MTKIISKINTTHPDIKNTLVYIIRTSILGTWVGIIVTFAVSGLLCEYGFDNGWGSIFYITGEFIGFQIFCC